MDLHGRDRNEVSHRKDDQRRQDALQGAEENLLHRNPGDGKRRHDAVVNLARGADLHGKRQRRGHDALNEDAYCQQSRQHQRTEAGAGRTLKTLPHLRKQVGEHKNKKQSAPSAAKAKTRAGWIARTALRRTCAGRSRCCWWRTEPTRACNTSRWMASTRASWAASICHVTSASGAANS